MVAGVFVYSLMPSLDQRKSCQPNLLLKIFPEDLQALSGKHLGHITLARAPDSSAFLHEAPAVKNWCSWVTYLQQMLMIPLGLCSRMATWLPSVWSHCLLESHRNPTGVSLSKRRKTLAHKIQLLKGQEGVGPKAHMNQGL